MPPGVSWVLANLRVFTHRARDQVNTGGLVQELGQPSGSRIELQAQVSVFQKAVGCAQPPRRFGAPPSIRIRRSTPEVVEAVAERRQVGAEGNRSARLIGEL